MAVIATDDDLRLFLLAELGPLKDDLSLDTTKVAAAAEDALDAYGADDIAGVPTDAASQRKLRALARVEAWRLAVALTAGDVDSSTDGQSLALSKRHEQAKGRLNDALARAAAYRPEAAVTLTVATYSNDPYAVATAGTEFG